MVNFINFTFSALLSPVFGARLVEMPEGDTNLALAQADDIASRIRFNTEFAQKLADEINTGTTVIVTDQPVVRNPVADSTYFAAAN